MGRTQGKVSAAPKGQPSSAQAANSGDAAAIDSVEIKVTILPEEELKAVRALEVHENTAQVRDIYFYDTPKLKLYNAGLILRARRVDGGTDDSTVKFRSLRKGAITPEWHKLKEFKMEVDCVGKREICSPSLTFPQERAEIDKVAKGTRPIQKLFSKEQENFIAAFHNRKFDFGELCVLGRIDVLRWKLPPKDFPYPVTVEEWRLPDREVLLEVSIKTRPEQKVRACKEFNTFLRGLKLNPKGDPETKTRAAMRCFAKYGPSGTQ